MVKSHQAHQQALYPRSVALTHTGHRRDQNQDAILADDALGLWLVADGMGGHTGGAVASEIAREATSEAMARSMDTVEAVQFAHRKILDAQTRIPALDEMGTTIVGLRESENQYQVFWTGDSRAYRLRSGALELLTTDHNYAGLLVENGTLSLAEARRHPQRHMLTECLGFVGRNEVRCDLRTGQWRPGDIVLLCSDGLSGEVEDEEISRILQATPDLQTAGNTLVQAALDAGGRDNISVVLIAAPNAGK